MLYYLAVVGIVFLSFISILVVGAALEYMGFIFFPRASGGASSPTPNATLIHESDSENIRLEKANTTRNNLILAINDISKQLFDIFFKVLSAPNFLLMLVATYKDFRQFLHSNPMLIHSYQLVIISYVVGILLYLTLLFYGHCSYAKTIKNIDNGIVKNQVKKNLVYEINNIHVLNKLPNCVKNLLWLSYILNAMSISFFILYLLFNI